MFLNNDSEDTKNLIDQILNRFYDLSYVGWCLFIVNAIGWYFSGKALRKSFNNEMNRISAEKKKLQEKLNNKKLKSSK